MSALPHDFRCPISLEIMSDPVILSSGHTFDRSSIQRWLDSGHRTCPVTKLPLPDPPSLIPNHALRSLISSSSSSPPPSPPPPTDFRSLLSSPLASRLDSLIRLVKRDPSARRRLAESGTVSHIIALLDNHHGGGGGNINPAVVTKVLTLILNLSLDDDNKVGLVAEGVITRISVVLSWELDVGDSRYSDCRAIAATVITSLAVVEVNKAVIGEDESIIGLLVGLVREGGVREKKEGLTALCTLCSTYEGNRRRALREGAVSAVVAAVQVDTGLARGLELLGMLGKCREGRIEMIKAHGCVRMLIKIVMDRGFRGNSNGSVTNSGKELEYGLMGLYWVCYESERIREEVRRESVEEECMELVNDGNGNEKVSRNARNLLKVLRGEIVRGTRN